MHSPLRYLARLVRSRRAFLAATLFSALVPLAGPSIASAELLTPAPPDDPLQKALPDALRYYGWKPEAIHFIAAHTQLIHTPFGAGSRCPKDVACSDPQGHVWVNLLGLEDRQIIYYVLNHELIHEMEYARGSGDASVGAALADVYELSTDAAYPLAADADKRVLQLTGRNDFAILDNKDWFHIEHDVLDGVGWNVGNLPAWYGAAYFPYLDPNPSASRAVTATSAGNPADFDARVQKALAAEASKCGPVLPGGPAPRPSGECGAPLDAWAGVPYGPMPGATGASAAAPVFQRPLPAFAAVVPTDGQMPAATPTATAPSDSADAAEVPSTATAADPGDGSDPDAGAS